MNLKVTIIFIISLLIATSCSIEKRRYTKGYHIEWNNNIAKRKSSIKKENNTRLQNKVVANNISIDTTKTDISSTIKPTTNYVSSVAKTKKKIIAFEENTHNLKQNISVKTFPIKNSVNSTKISSGDFDYFSDMFGIVGVILVILLCIGILLSLIAFFVANPISLALTMDDIVLLIALLFAAGIFLFIHVNTQ